MRDFIVVRHGSNAANQSRRNRMVLGTVQAADAPGAKLAAEQKWTRYNNQRFEVLDLAGRTRKADRDAASIADAMEG